MKHISKRISVILLSTVICCVFCESTVFALSKIGSRGQEVTNIQTRLKSWGYYSGNIDGIYGWRTANAVKEFQRKNGPAEGDVTVMNQHGAGEDAPEDERAKGAT